MRRLLAAVLLSPLVAFGTIAAAYFFLPWPIAAYLAAGAVVVFAIMAAALLGMAHQEEQAERAEQPPRQ